MHWADEPSLRWLAYLAHRLDGLPILLLLGTRPAEQANLPALVTELLADPGAIAIRPSSLGETSAATLARGRLGAEPDPDYAAALQKGSGGNPLSLCSAVTGCTACARLVREASRLAAIQRGASRDAYRFEAP